jgi:UDP-glucose 4-epimerase
VSVLVTGGAGYIGSVTVERLVREGRRVVVLDDLSKGHLDAVHEGAVFIQGAIGDGGLVRSLIREHAIDSVIHFAAMSLVGESMEHPGEYYDANVVQAARLLDALTGCGVSKLVFSSSAGVYGEPESIPISEGHPTRPVNVYGETKLAFERILELYGGRSGLRSISLRYFNAAGASERFGEDHDPETHLIPIALDVALEKRPELTVFGDDYDTPDGTCIRDYIDVRDLSDAHILALAALDRDRTGVYNLGTGEGWSVLNVLDAVEDVTGRTVRRAVGARRDGDPARLVASSSKAEKELGWKPMHRELRDMVDSAWRWRQRYPNGYER